MPDQDGDREIGPFGLVGEIPQLGPGSGIAGVRAVDDLEPARRESIRDLLASIEADARLLKLLVVFRDHHQRDPPGGARACGTHQEQSRAGDAQRLIFQ